MGSRNVYVEGKLETLCEQAIYDPKFVKQEFEGWSDLVQEALWLFFESRREDVLAYREGERAMQRLEKFNGEERQ